MNAINALWPWVRGVLIVVGGGALGFVAACVFVFCIYNVPFTTTGIDGVSSNVLPAAVFCGCAAGIYFAIRWSGNKR